MMAVKHGCFVLDLTDKSIVVCFQSKLHTWRYFEGKKEKFTLGVGTGWHMICSPEHYV
jgi:hypothetical protein